MDRADFEWLEGDMVYWGAVIDWARGVGYALSWGDGGEEEVVPTVVGELGADPDAGAAGEVAADASDVRIEVEDGPAFLAEWEIAGAPGRMGRGGG